MAPVSEDSHQKDVEQQIKAVIDDLFDMMVQVTQYDLTSKSSAEVLEKTVQKLDKNLQTTHGTANHPTKQLPSIPPELIQYVDNGRNPDIYTREFVELARKGNQLMKGKLEAFGSFRDELAVSMGLGLPELREQVKEVVARTGGNTEAFEEAIKTQENAA